MTISIEPMIIIVIMGIEAIAIILAGIVTYSLVKKTRMLSDYIAHGIHNLEARIGKQAERLASMEGVLNTILTSIRSKP